MSQQRLTESLEKTKQRIARRESRRDTAPPFPGGLHPILQLQRMLGNRRVAELIQAQQLTSEGKMIGLQRKLTVGAAGDLYEQEADHVARQVLNTSDALAANSMQRAMSAEEDQDPMLQPKPLAASITPFIQRQMVHNAASEDEEHPVQAKFLTETRRAPLQRQPETEEEETEPLQAKSAGALTESFEAGANVETQVSQSKGRGSPLPDPVRAYMEPRFGVDFSQVRVHTGSEARQMNHAVGAQAFTHGSDIYFGSGGSPTDLALTAHELTHVVQQTGGGEMKKPPEMRRAPAGADIPAPRQDPHLLRRPPRDARHVTGDEVTFLQRAAGNTAVNHLLQVQREGPPAPVEPNFDELTKAYQDARESEHALYDRRLIGAEEALANLGEANAPSIGDIILHAAIMGALGFASGGITQAITGRMVVSTASDAIKTAVQSGLDDALKDAVPAAVDKVLSRESTSRSSFFAGVKEGVVELRKGAVRGLNAEELKVKTTARANPATLTAALKAIQSRATAVDATAQTARDLQYRESLSQWLTAMAKGELGTTDTGGAKMKNMPGHGEDPSRIFHQDATAGVVRLSFGIKSARRPLTINFGLLQGLNDATKEQLKNTTLNDLRIPIFAQGWIIDGFWDGVVKGDNEVTISRNEQNTVYVNYGSDAEDAMLSSAFAKGETSVVDVAIDVMRNDIGTLKLGSIDGIG